MSKKVAEENKEMKEFIKEHIKELIDTYISKHIIITNIIIKDNNILLQLSKTNDKLLTKEAKIDIEKGYVYIKSFYNIDNIVVKYI